MEEEEEEAAAALFVKASISGGPGRIDLRLAAFLTCARRLQVSKCPLTWVGAVRGISHSHHNE